MKLLRVQRRENLFPSCCILQAGPSRGTQRCQRFSSSSSTKRVATPYPFPNTPDPTPYQIFHLMPDASPTDVKQRYYELVKLYHPDSAESRLREQDPTRRHAHFSAITRAYSRLQKRAVGVSDGDGVIDADVAEGVVNPSWRRAPSMYPRRYEEPRFVDDRWKDRFIWGILGLSFVSVAAQVIVVRRRRFQELSDHIHANEAVPITWNVPQGTSDEDMLRLKRPKQS